MKKDKEISLFGMRSKLLLCIILCRLSNIYGRWIRENRAGRVVLTDSLIRENLRTRENALKTQDFCHLLSRWLVAVAF